MVKILQLQGTDAELYTLVAPLVMNPKILKYNNNYPFKTDDSFTWIIAMEDEKVRGFFPVEIKGSIMVINNYYVDEKEESTFFPVLLEAAIQKQSELGKRLQAVVMLRHIAFFEAAGFKTIKQWKVYQKMEK